MKTKLFVYGTLKKGYHLHSLLNKSKYIKDFITEPLFDMTLVGDHYPIVSRMDNGYRIKGEIYKCSPFDFTRIKYVELTSGYQLEDLTDDIKIFVQKYPQQKKSLFIDEIKNRTLVWNSNKYIVADIRQSHEEYGLGDTLGGEA